MAEPEKIGKYRIDGVLGKGAMGVVYKGFDPGIERTVAIKTVRKDLVDPDLAVQVMARFKNEAKAAGRLLHPNIVSVYEYGEDGKRGKLWPGLREHFTRPGAEIPFEDMKERMLFSESLDTVRLFEEGVLTSVADANIGSIMGIGFPAWTGTASTSTSESCGSWSTTAPISSNAAPW